MVSPSIIRKHPNILEATSLIPEGPDVVGKVVENVMWSSVFQQWPIIPFEEEHEYEALVIVPRDLSCKICEDLIQYFTNYLKRLSYLRMTAPDVYTQQKYREAESFIASIRQRWNQKLTSNAFQELRNTRII